MKFTITNISSGEGSTFVHDLGYMKRGRFTVLDIDKDIDGSDYINTSAFPVTVAYEVVIALNPNMSDVRYIGRRKGTVTFDVGDEMIIPEKVYIVPSQYLKYIVLYEQKITFIVDGVTTEAAFSNMVLFEVQPSVVSTCRYQSRSGNLSFQNGKFTGPASWGAYSLDSKEFTKNWQTNGQVFANVLTSPGTLINVTSQIMDYFMGKRKISGAFGKGDIEATHTVDCTFSEQMVDEVAVTEHPVEIGASISDHAYLLPVRYTVTGGFSTGLDSLAGELDRFNPATVGDNPMIGQYKQLLAIKTAMALCKIVTKKRVYTNMFLTKLTVATDNDTENVLNYTAEFRQIIQATTTTSLVDIKDAANPSDIVSPEATGTVTPVKVEFGSTLDATLNAVVGAAR